MTCTQEKCADFDCFSVSTWEVCNASISVMCVPVMWVSAGDEGGFQHKVGLSDALYLPENCECVAHISLIYLYLSFCDNMGNILKEFLNGGKCDSKV